MKVPMRFRWNDVTVQTTGELRGAEVRIAAHRAPPEGTKIAVRTGSQGDEWTAFAAATVVRIENGGFFCRLEGAAARPDPVPLPSPVEQRSSPRADTLFKVRFASARAFVEQHATNLSKGGIFVATSRQLPIGTSVRIEMALPDGGPPFDVQARVVRAVQAGDPAGRKPGLGLQFVGPTVAMEERVDAFMRVLAGS